MLVDDPVTMISPVAGKSVPGGAVEVDEGGKQVKVVTWNTGDRKKWAASEDNSTHAEHQFVDWLSRQQFRSDIIAIKIEMTSPKEKDSPCPSCVDDLKRISEFAPKAAKRELHYTGIYTSKAVDKDAAEKALRTLVRLGWEVPKLGAKPGDELHPVK